MKSFLSSPFRSFLPPSKVFFLNTRRFCGKTRTPPQWVESFRRSKARPLRGNYFIDKAGIYLEQVLLI